jgi:hypothetical protein
MEFRRTPYRPRFLKGDVIFLLSRLGGAKSSVTSIHDILLLEAFWRVQNLGKSNWYDQSIR